MNKRYIISKDVFRHLNMESKLAIEEFPKDEIITKGAFHFKYFNKVSVDLSEIQVSFLKNKGFQVVENKLTHQEILAGNYEKIRSRFVKATDRTFTGKGCKIAILDTGLNVSSVPVEHAVNFATAQPGVGNNSSHGTPVTSVIKDQTIGIAPDAEIFFCKVADDAVLLLDAIMAALDYCIDNQVNAINMSFSADGPGLQDLLNDCISAGIVLFAASGNSTSEDAAVSRPACFPGVVSVNAVSENMQVFGRNVITPNFPPDFHGPTVACSGINCEVKLSNGSYSTTSGTSFSCPFMVGLFGVYYEMLNGSSNYIVLDYILGRVKKQWHEKYFGLGLLTF